MVQPVNYRDGPPKPNKSSVKIPKWDWTLRALVMVGVVIEVLGHRHIPVVLLGAGVILLSAVLYLTMLVRSGRLPWRPRSRGIT
jgi:hypothetical protein